MTTSHPKNRPKKNTLSPSPPLPLPLPLPLPATAPKKRQRMNKYEKRRLKAARAKQEKQQKQDQQQEEVDEPQQAQNNASSSSVWITEPTTQSQNDSSSKESLAMVEAGFEDDDDKEDNNNSTPQTTTDNNNNNESDEDDQQRKKDAEHAAYMAEFHARPLELDRRSGAVVKSLPRRQSRSTTLLEDEDASPSAIWKDRFQLQLNAKIVALAQRMYPRGPTLIQERVLQTTLSTTTTTSNPKNIWIQSETGSGKTMAYFLPIVQTLYQRLLLDNNNNNNNNKGKHTRTALGTQCIIVCPTQELVHQTHVACETICNQLCAGQLVVGSLRGQASRSKEKARLRKGLAVIVSTPGRLLDHLQTTRALQTAVANANLQWLVLDEVDRLFDMGLAPQLKSVMACLKQYTTTTTTTTSTTSTTTSSDDSIPWRSMLVSATVPESVQELVQECLASSSSLSLPNTVTKNNKDNSNFKSQYSKEWAWIQGGGGGENNNNIDHNGEEHTATPSSSDGPSGHATMTHASGRSLPKQLTQYHITVSAKLRLTTLVSFLAARIAQGERTVVFMSTCASVDYYHALFNTMDCILSSSTPSSSSTLSNKKYADQQQHDNKNKNAKGGIFGMACSIDKLHGNVPQQQRQAVLQQFQKVDAAAAEGADGAPNNNKTKNKKAPRVLLATDVAARGLNLQADFTVQYDPPCELDDYIHRAGRVARAGQLGQSVLFLLPSETGLLKILQQQQQRQTLGENVADAKCEMAALSLASTLQQGARLCPDLTHQGMQRNGMRGTRTASSDGNNPSTSGGKGGSGSRVASRQGEAFCAELQYRLEECVLEHSKKQKKDQKVDNNNKSKKMNNRKGGGPKGKATAAGADAPVTTLLDMARSAFLSFMRAYPTKEKLVRHIFSARALHLGHIAKSFALREPPKTLVKNSRGSGFAADVPGLMKANKKRNAAFAFSGNNDNVNGGGDDHNDNNNNNKNKKGNSSSTGQKRAMLMANAAKLQAGGFDSF